MRTLWIAALLAALAAAGAHLDVVFVWHMHQPPYVAPNGTALAPWARLWVDKGYYPMVALALEEGAHVTFDFTPTLLMQLAMVAGGRYRDPFLQVDTSPVLTQAQKAFVLANYFSAPPVQIERYPRYACLRDRVNALVAQHGGITPEVVSSLSDQDYLDLRVLFNLAWQSLYLLERNSTLRGIYLRALSSDCGTHFAWEDLQALTSAYGFYARQLLGLLRLAGRGSLEVVTTPMYYPIMPLVVDLKSALEDPASAGMVVPPTGFAYPQDVYGQLVEARRYFAAVLGYPPFGLWPPEMAVSDAALALAARAGFRYSFISGRTLALAVGGDPGLLNYALLYRSYGRQTLYLLARDDAISNYLGFGASGDVNSMGPTEAARKAFGMVEAVRDRLEAAGVRRGVLVIALDGENPWQYFRDDGVAFLTALYRLLKNSSDVKMRTASTAVDSLRHEAVPLARLKASSWSEGFWTWVGNWRQNLAWTILYFVRQRPANMTCMYLAEMGDWTFWYSGFFQTATPELFDGLFRSYAKCALGGNPYNYTWPLDVPIYFRGDGQVGWAGARQESYVVPEGPVDLPLEVWLQQGSTARAILHFGPVEAFGGPWRLLYFVPMNFSGWSGNNRLFTARVRLRPGLYEFVYLAQGLNEYWVHTSDGGNFRLTVVPRPDGTVQDAYVAYVRVGGTQYQPQGAPSCVYAPAGSTVAVAVAVKASGTVYPTLYYGRGSYWWPIWQVLAQPTGQAAGGYAVYEASISPGQGYYEYVFQILTASGPYWVHVQGGNGALCITN